MRIHLLRDILDWVSVIVIRKSLILKPSKPHISTNIWTCIQQSSSGLHTYLYYQFISQLIHTLLWCKGGQWHCHGRCGYGAINGGFPSVSTQDFLRFVCQIKKISFPSFLFILVLWRLRWMYKASFTDLSLCVEAACRTFPLTKTRACI